MLVLALGPFGVVLALLLAFTRLRNNRTARVVLVVVSLVVAVLTVAALTPLTSSDLGPVTEVGG